MIAVYLNVKSCRLVEMLQNFGDVCCLFECSELCLWRKRNIAWIIMSLFMGILS